MGQNHAFYGDTYKAARDIRDKYEADCQSSGTIARRISKTAWERLNDRLVRIETEYEFTDLQGNWTEAAEANGILRYWWIGLTG